MVKKKQVIRTGNGIFSWAVRVFCDAKFQNRGKGSFSYTGSTIRSYESRCLLYREFVVILSGPVV